MNFWLRVGLNTLGSTARGWAGLMVSQAAVQPVKLLKVYEYEACPYCRLVREALTELGLEAMVYPCPKGGQRFRPEARAMGGQEQFPLLIDDNTGATLYESGLIIEYLFKTYGQKDVPLRYKGRPLQVLSSVIDSTLGFGAGLKAVPSRAPELPLVLYSFEASPFSRLVRERLCELELPYHLVNMGKEQFADMGAFGVHATLKQYVPKPGGKREQFLNKTNKVMLPYLEDPNTDKSMFESRDIIAYLNTTYAV